VPAFVVFNAAPHSATTLLEDARAIVAESGLMTAPTVLRERGAYRAAWPIGKTVIETEPKGKAAKEISALANWVLAQLQVCTPSKVQKRKTVTNA
jgi:chromosome partitioning protein